MTSISQPDMAEHIRLGQAHPMLPEGTPGPVFFARRWWIVRAAGPSRAGGEDYVLADDHEAAQLTASSKHLAELAGDLPAAGPGSIDEHRTTS